MMAPGTPVVSTAIRVESLQVTHGEDILIADEPAEFARAVVRLLGDEALRVKLAVNGRSLVEERYDWNQIGESLEQFLCRVVEKDRSTDRR